MDEGGSKMLFTMKSGELAEGGRKGLLMMKSEKRDDDEQGGEGGSGEKGGIVKNGRFFC